VVHRAHRWDPDQGRKRVANFGELRDGEVRHSPMNCYDGPVTELQTPRLLLRPWRAEDLDPYARMCADSDVMRYMPKTMSREESSQQLSGFINHWQKRGFGLWAVEEKASGAFIGRIGLMVHDDWPEGAHKTEVGWMLERHYWGRGLATEGALASVSYGFEELGLERIISITLPENAASRRVMGKVGLTYRGSTCWRDHDVVWYAADRREWGTGGSY
jgi:RimJ/RimL family protein N-acetyltransferase